MTQTERLSLSPKYVVLRDGYVVPLHPHIRADVNGVSVTVYAYVLRQGERYRAIVTGVIVNALGITRRTMSGIPIRRLAVEAVASELRRVVVDDDACRLERVEEPMATHIARELVGWCPRRAT